MEGQLKCIEYEANNNLQWNKEANKYKLTFKKFIKSQKSVSDLSDAFQDSYEQCSIARDKRRKQAKFWYNYLK